MEPNRRVESRRLIDAGWLAAMPMILNVVSVGANGYIIRTLGEEGYGSLVVALGLSGATTLLGNLGMRALYTKAVAGADDATTARLLSEQLALRLMLTLVAGSLATIAAALLYPDNPIIIACTGIQAVGLLATISWTVLADVLNAREQFRENARIALVAGLVLTTLAVIAAAVGGGPVLVATAYLAGPMVNFALQARAIRRMKIPIRLGGATWRRYRELLHEARALAMNDVVSIVHSRAEGVWAPLLFGVPRMGAYAAGTLPMSRLSMASDGVATAYFPAMASAHTREEAVAMREHAVGMFTLLIAVSLPLGLYTWFGAPYLADLLFPGADQVTARTICQFTTRVSALAIPLEAIALGMRYATQAAGGHSRNAKEQMAASTIGAVTSLGLAFAVGIEGLVIGLVVRSALLCILQRPTMSRSYPGLGRSLPWRTLLTPSAALLLVLGATLGMSHPSLGVAVVIGGGSALMYGAVSLKLGLIERPG